MDLLDMLDELDTVYLECGHRSDERDASFGVDGRDRLAHAEHCLKLVCPRCRLTARNAFSLVQDHDIRFDGLCSAQGWQFDRFACCMACRWPTFGRWPCRNQACPAHECGDECAANDGSPNYLDTHPWGKDAEIGRQSLAAWKKAS